MTDSKQTLGFVGLGVMGEPMCRNLAAKSDKAILAYDLQPAPLARLSGHGVKVANNMAEISRSCEIVFICLPSGAHLETICKEIAAVPVSERGVKIIIDMGTSPVSLTRALFYSFAKDGVTYVDAPIARTRAAAEQGSLSVMVGADDDTYAIVHPLVSCMATDIIHCGAVGSGQVAKILNNMVLVQTVAALSEALAMAKAANVDAVKLFDAFSKGSADSFALRNHGMKAILPQAFPERAFSVEYALKDMGYAAELAVAAKVEAGGLVYATRLLKMAIEKGFGQQYWPVISKIF